LAGASPTPTASAGRFSGCWATADDPPGRASAAGRDGNEERVSIAQRVAPLKELLRQAQAAGKDVTWGL
jgi:hypothetical protein